MEEKLDNKLTTAFPLLYRDRRGSMQSTCMIWGFPGPGWFNLIWDLSSKLEPLIQKYLDEEKPVDCAQCGCDRKLHEEAWEGGAVNPLNKQCWNIHYLPYRFAWKWKSIGWPSKANNWNDCWNIFKTKYLYYGLIHRVKNWIARSINFVLDLLHEQFGLTRKLPCHCKKFLLSHPCASQVKEKFGTLRFYMTTETEEMSALIREAEERSAVTCEECGSPGTCRDGGWILTLCDKCAVERKGSDAWFDNESIPEEKED